MAGCSNKKKQNIRALVLAITREAAGRAASYCSVYIWRKAAESLCRLQFSRQFQAVRERCFSLFALCNTEVGDGVIFKRNFWGRRGDAFMWLCRPGPGPHHMSLLILAIPALPQNSFWLSPLWLMPFSDFSPFLFMKTVNPLAFDFSLVQSIRDTQILV